MLAHMIVSMRRGAKSLSFLCPDQNAETLIGPSAWYSALLITASIDSAQYFHFAWRWSTAGSIIRTSGFSKPTYGNATHRLRNNGWKSNSISPKSLRFDSLNDNGKWMIVSSARLLNNYDSLLPVKICWWSMSIENYQIPCYADDIGYIDKIYNRVGEYCFDITH